METTTNHQFNVPKQDTRDWHEPVNDNFQKHDTAIEIRGPEDELENYEPKEGRSSSRLTPAEYISGLGNDGESSNSISVAKISSSE